MAYLREQGLLALVKQICSVSGGSILAAHLVMYWNDYAGEDVETYRRRVRRLVAAITTRDVSGNVLKRSLLKVVRLKTLDSEKLVNEYRGMLVTKDSAIQRWDDLDRHPDYPELHILATHLNTGRACAYSRSGFHISAVGSDQRHADVINAFANFANASKVRDQEIARAVAASSAFPPAFGPLPLVPGNTTHLLTDGGVYDNSGVNYLRELYKARELTNSTGRLVVMSDAGREFPTEMGSQYATFAALAMRVTDTQGDRVAEADRAAAKLYFDGHHIPSLGISIHCPIPYFPNRPDNHSEKVQERLATIRTELNEFAPEEVFVLFRQGYLVAQQEYLEYLHPGADLSDRLAGVPWTPVDPESTEGNSAGKPGASGAAQALALLDKTALEQRLAESHIVKKYATIGRNAALAGAVIALAVFLLGMGAQAILFRPTDLSPPIIQEADARGTLPISEVVRYQPGSWVDSIPALVPFLHLTGPRYFYLVETESIKKLTGDHPHRAASIHPRLTEVTGERPDCPLPEANDAKGGTPPRCPRTGVAVETEAAAGRTDRRDPRSHCQREGDR